MDKKIKKASLVVGIVSVLLICVFIVMSLFFNSKWVKGIYLYDNEIVIYSNSNSIQFQVGAVIVGENIENLSSRGDLECSLIGENENILAECFIVSSLKTKHYYETELIIECDIPQGEHLFHSLEIKCKNGPQLISYSSGNIKIIILDQENNQDIETIMISSRTSDTCDFAYGVINPTLEDIYITDIDGYLDDNNAILKVTDSLDIGSDSIDLNSVKAFDFPIKIPTNKEVYFYYSIPLTEKTQDLYMYFCPLMTYHTSNDNAPQKLYYVLASSPPLIHQLPEEVLDFISSKINK